MSFSRRTALIVSVTALVSAGVAAVNAGQGTLKRHVGGALGLPDNVGSAHFTNRLIVKFAEGRVVRLRDGKLVAPDGGDLEQLPTVLRSRDVVRVTRLFQRDEATLEQQRAAGTLRSGVELPDLNNYFRLHLAPGTPNETVHDILRQLYTCRCVELAYPETVPVDAFVSPCLPAPPVITLLSTPDFSDLQGYLYDPPYGVDGVRAHGFVGGRGAGAYVVDVERDWNENHEDLPEFFFFDVPTPREPYNNHGTAVVGEIIGVDNGYGVLGLSPDARIGGSTWKYRGVPAAIDAASAALEPGGIILLEVQYVNWDHRLFPIEYDQAVFDAILTAAANGRAVVEAAGNGSEDLDDPFFGGMFDRGVRDSGAIMVAAGGASDLRAMWFTNYGSRIDVHAWGELVVTAGYGDLYYGTGRNQWYTAEFSGTSSASPMATAGAAVLQGVCAQNGRPLLGPLAVRQILHDSGTPHEDPWYEIGPRVRCAAAVAQLDFPIGLAPLSFEVVRGRLRAGGTEELLASDDKYLVVDSRLRPVPLVHSRSCPAPLGKAYAVVQVAKQIHAAPLARLDLLVESSNLLSPATQELRLYNYATDGFDSLDTREVGFGDTVVLIEDVPNPDDYVDPATGDLLVEVRNVAPVSPATNSFRNRLDQVRLTITYE